MCNSKVSYLKTIPEHKESVYKIYTDGSFKNNVIGYGVIIENVCTKTVIKTSGALILEEESEAKNGAKIAEITAGISALKIINENADIHMFTDSSTLYNMLSSNGKRLKLNSTCRKLNKILIHFLKQHNITPCLIKRYGIKENRTCDYLARDARENLKNAQEFNSLLLSAI